ncbi:hypothetical protein DFH06DRAFT_1153543 [Mycena polygramma]|nr:hypothetical protein DFH06DRAFT_1153543 [Mycena polygramma]
MTAALLEYPARHHYAPHQAPPTKVQVVRSVSGWSHGVLTEHRIQHRGVRALHLRRTFQFFLSEIATWSRDERIVSNGFQRRGDREIAEHEFIDRLFFFWDTAGRFIVLGLDYGAGRPCLTT